MAKMAKQMELFDEGGLMDEGGTTDPVSGNDVPPGSTQEEVRDDIPAQLSEGEFVVPADVVRYIGLENLMRMRQEAKQGLAEMEAMGQMGNSEEATMPDDLPFDEYDLEVEDDGQGELNLQTGGFIPPSLPNQVNPQTGVYTMPGTGITGFQQYQQQPTGFTPTSAGIPTPYFQPVQFSGPQFTTALQTTNLPTFAETVGSKAGQYDELRTYQNDAGQTLQIPFKNGQPIYPVPEGYKPIGDQPKPEEAPTTVTPTLGQTQVSDTDGAGTNNSFIGGQSADNIKSGVASAKDRYAVTGNRGIDLLNFLPGGMFLKNLLGADDEPSMGLFSNTPEAMPTGLTDSMITSASADYMKNLGGLPSTDIMTETTRTSGSPLPNTNVLPASAKTVRNLQNLRGMLGVSPTRYVGFNKGDLDPNSGGFFNKDGVAINPETGGAAKNESGTMNYSSFEDFRNAIAAGIESGWRGGVISSTEYNNLGATGKANYDKYADITKNRKGGGVSVSQIAIENKAKADEAADKARADKEIADARAAKAKTDSYVERSKGRDSDFGGFDDKSPTGDAEDEGDFAFKSGGLTKQMKRSGLASKK